MESWRELLIGGAYLPRGDCLLWQPSMIALHAVSDFFIAIAFFVIPLAMLRFLRLRRDLPDNSRRLAGFFMLFISACGMTHLISIVTVWMPVYWVHGMLAAVTASLSVATAVVMWPLIPQILRLPSPGRLQAEVAAHLRTLDELKAAQKTLEERVETRTHELREANERFEIALRNAPIMVATQDRDLRYTWAHNLPPGWDESRLIGHTDEEGVLPAEAAGKVTTLKRGAMETGSSQASELTFELDGQKKWFDLLVEPLRDGSSQVIGVTTVALDITQRKQSEDQLRVLLRELTHRSKNLLAVIQAIARQTASRTGSLDTFLDQFGARLVSIGSAHDLLVAGDWTGASLRTLLTNQLGAYGDFVGSRITLTGDDLNLKPDATQNIALAIHELVINAAKYGALSRNEGEVDITWSVEEGEKPILRLVWKETGGPAVEQPDLVGFGRMMIERVVGKALDGEVKLDFEPDGVRCAIEIPARHIL